MKNRKPFLKYGVYFEDKYSEHFSNAPSSVLEISDGGKVAEFDRLIEALNELLETEDKERIGEVYEKIKALFGTQENNPKK